MAERRHPDWSGWKTPPIRIAYTERNGDHRYGAAEARNDVPWKPYRRDAGAADAGAVERVCRWRRSLIAAAMVLQLAAEQAGE